MNRRDVLKATLRGGALAVFGPALAQAKTYYPMRVEESLWQEINRVKNPSALSFLEKVHSPVITAPEKVNASELFPVHVVIGRIRHPMGPSHWIEHLQLNIGNEPAGDVTFQAHGYCSASATFDVALGNELKGKSVSLIVQIKCNLHGIWQNEVRVDIV